MKTNNKTLLLVAACALLFNACDKDNDPPVEKTTELTVPVNYNFDNVDYSGQTARLNMLAELSTYMKTANTSGVALDAKKMKDMFANANSPFSQTDLNTIGKQLRDKTYANMQGLIDGYIDSLAANSKSSVAGEKGVTGVVDNGAGKKYLMNAKGIEYIQLIEKGIMGATFYYQALSYSLEEIKNKDNTTITPGKGTEMEHSWDEAFGYFGVEKDFPANSSTRFWGTYSKSRNNLLGTNQKVMGAFLKGRAAIAAKDNVKRDEAIIAVREQWETICAATAISYLNQAKQSFNDDAVRNHVLSEAIAFIDALQYNPNKKITVAQINAAQNYIGDNLYEVSIANLDKAREILSTVYGLQSVETVL